MHFFYLWMNAFLLTKQIWLGRHKEAATEAETGKSLYTNAKRSSFKLLPVFPEEHNQFYGEDWTKFSRWDRQWVNNYL